MKKLPNNPDTNRRNFAGGLILGGLLTTLPSQVNASLRRIRIETTVQGDNRRVSVTGMDLSELHKEGASTFTKMLEGDFQNKKRFYRVKKDSFHFSLAKKNGEYTLSYEIELEPVKPTEKHIRIVGTQGSIMRDKKDVEKENMKKMTGVIGWPERMKKRYISPNSGTKEFQFLRASFQAYGFYAEEFLGLGIEY